MESVRSRYYAPRSVAHGPQKTSAAPLAAQLSTDKLAPRLPPRPLWRAPHLRCAPFRRALSAPKPWTHGHRRRTITTAIPPSPSSATRHPGTVYVRSLHPGARVSHTPRARRQKCRSLKGRTAFLPNLSSRRLPRRSTHMLSYCEARFGRVRWTAVSHSRSRSQERDGDLKPWHRKRGPQLCRAPLDSRNSGGGNHIRRLGTPRVATGCQSGCPTIYVHQVSVKDTRYQPRCAGA
ncbi:hypothetical protein BD310DRAFT_912625 [Dichomitus squalens]|uniref:Uncharacterized protein n=1 Tax=Dichomitus squalens TaxID=114155 RepID=A0A4Q9QDY6_9APHY|nr:hypothetical protein BD310DRAFT_912625 [Dichomitus squalens]